MVQSEDSVSYSCVLSDTAVTFKASAMPTRAKKQKGDIKQPCRDFNQNILIHTDQFANPVWVQGIVEQPVICTQVQGQQPQVTERQLDVNPMNQSIEALRANRFIQQLVEERVAVLESRMKSELQQGSQPWKKSRRYNIADTPHTFAGLMNPVWLALSIKKLHMTI